MKKNNEHVTINEGSKFLTASFDLLESVTTALVLVTVFLTVVCMKFDVIGSSMLPTLRNNDKLLVYHLMYEPQRGDIVTINNPGQLDRNIVKRIIAKGNDSIRVDFEKGNVFVNDQLLTEPYIYMPTTQKANWNFPEKVPEGYYFVMGDNRGNSKDSRSKDVGLIKKDDIMGKAIAIYSPFDRIGIPN
ncbi:MAG: Signal peptidase I U [Eubacteriales bacterium SKADARSKE-1]|nr:Signal peptidase I U [Eubacteriales bacterium SKADARSKE-1]